MAKENPTATSQQPYQYQRQYESELKTIRLDNFSLGYCPETDETVQNSKGLSGLSEAININIDKVTGTITKRPGITYDTDRFGTLAGAGFDLRKVFEFTGGDNTLCQVLVRNSGNDWDIYFRNGDISYVNIISLQSSLTNLPASFFSLLDGEEPCFDAVDGVLRIGLGNNITSGWNNGINDPLTVYYNRREQYFGHKHYGPDGSTETIDTTKLWSGLAKEWCIERQVPQYSNTYLTPTIETQGRLGNFPSVTVHIDLWALVTALRTAVPHTKKRIFVRFNVENEHLSRWLFKEWEFTSEVGDALGYISADSMLVSYLGGWQSYFSTAFVNGGENAPTDTELSNFGTYCITQMTAGFAAITNATVMTTLANQHWQDTFSYTIRQDTIATRAYGESGPVLSVTVAVKSLGSAGTDWTPTKKIDTAPYYYEKYFVPFQVNDDSRFIYFRDDASLFQDAYRGSSSTSFSPMMIPNLKTTFTIDNPNIQNLSQDLKVGTYEFKLTLMFNNEETIPILVGTGIYTLPKVEITHPTQKIGLRLQIPQVAPSHIIDRRLNAINIYLKRTIPVTDKMTPEERSEAAEYTDMDFRLIRTIDMVFSEQEMRDTLRQNVDLNSSDPIGVNPMCWKWIDTKPTIDYIYSDLISGSELPQSVSQEENYGFLLDRLQRSDKDEGIIQYSGSEFYKGKRYVYRAKKKLAIDKTEYIEYGDRIYYSLATSNLEQLDIVSNDTWISVRDSEIVTKIVIFRDNLMIFSGRDLYRTDIDQTSENLSLSVIDAFVGQGTEYYETVVSTDAFILWGNSQSVWYYDGRQLLDMLDDKWKTEYQEYIEIIKLDNSKSIYDLFGGFCTQDNTYWLRLSLPEHTIWVLSIENGAWVKYVRGIECIRFWTGLNNRFYIVGTDFISLYGSRSAGMLLYTDIEIDGGSNLPYHSYFVTLDLVSTGSTDKQFQNIIIRYSINPSIIYSTVKNQLGIVYQQNSSNYGSGMDIEKLIDASGNTGVKIILPDTSVNKLYESINLPVPFGADQGLLIRVSDGPLLLSDTPTNDINFIIKYIDVFYAEIDVPSLQRSYITI